MNPWKYHIVTCADLAHLNPVNSDRFHELIELLDLAAGDRVLDVACGKAECLIQIASHYAISGIGVDLCAEFLESARAGTERRVPSTSALAFLEQDGASYTAPDGSFDLTICLGASWVFGGYQGTVRRLASLTRSGGQVMIGEPFWIREPEADYLKATDTSRVAYESHAGNVMVGEQEGLSLLYTLVSSPADWDRYEGRRWRAAERYAVSCPDDPDVPAILDRVRRNRKSYLQWGRNCLGWAIYLFRKA